MARVFAVENMVSRGIHIFIWCLLAAYTPILIIWSAVCIPIQTLWDPNVENPYCLNQRKVFFSSLSLSILTDIIILMVPIPLTWALRMPVRKKMKIVLLLSAGGAATALTIYRTIKAVRFLDSDDITVDFVIIGILTYVLDLLLSLIQIADLVQVSRDHDRFRLRLSPFSQPPFRTPFPQTRKRESQPAQDPRDVHRHGQKVYSSLGKHSTGDRVLVQTRLRPSAIRREPEPESRS